ncbi:succinate dehydrogenase [Alcaligenes sp. Marseille-Q7550]
MNSPRNTVRAVRMWYWQRLSAMLMTVFVFTHLGLILYAMQDGLSATEILQRTRGNALWGVFYSAFVILVSLHGALGLRAVLVEWTRLSPAACTRIAHAIGLVLLALGLRAVWAVTLAGA